MPHERFEFEMPASAEVVFDAFHHHTWRSQWDSLVRDTRVEGGAAHPEVGLHTYNRGRGLLRLVVMTTRFVSYERPKLAAAVMEGRVFPFARWAASMRHEPMEDDDTRSRMVYTYTFETWRPLRRWLDPLVKRAFDRQTLRRFDRMQVFLRRHAGEVAAWQREQGLR